MILTTSPSITQKEIDYVTDAITNGHGEHWGDYVKKFEKSFAEYIGVKHAMTTSSCTGALHLSLVALGIGEGDEVIVPDMSWIATASVVRYVGATPIFADVSPDSWCISPDSIEKNITTRTKAIMPVHLYGHPSDMESIMNLAKHYNLKVIEDAAPSVGATFKGRKTGSFGNIAGFSFQGAKILSTGEGGMIVTDDSELFCKIKHLAEHGRSSNGFDISIIGFKYKMSNLQAAWGCAQLDRIDELVSKKRLIYGWYKEELSGIGSLAMNKESNEIENPIFWMTSIVLDTHFDVSRNQLMSKLKDKDVDTRPFFPPMSSFKMFKSVNNPYAIYMGENGVNLPSGHDLTRDQVSYICENIKNILKIK